MPRCVLRESTGTLEGYKYLGLSTVVERDHAIPGVNQTFISQTGSTGDAGDKYTGLDRFGRVADWRHAASAIPGLLAETVLLGNVAGEMNDSPTPFAGPALSQRG